MSANDSIENMIATYEQEYITFARVEELPQYKIEQFEMKIWDVNKAGFGSLAQSAYNPRTDEHILRVCSNREVMKYVVFHELTHMLDSEIYAKNNPVRYTAISGFTEYHASQIELMELLGANTGEGDFSFSMDTKIQTYLGERTVKQYVRDRQQAAIDIFSMPNFPANIETLKVAIGVLYNYLGLRSICKMYAEDYVEEINNRVFLKFIPTMHFITLNNQMNGWLNGEQIEESMKTYINIIFPLIKEYGLA